MKESPHPKWFIPLVVLLAVAAAGLFIWGYDGHRDSSEAKKKIASLDKEYANARESLQNVEQQLQGERITLEERDRELEAARKRISALEHTLAEKATELKRLQSRLSSTRDELSESETGHRQRARSLKEERDRLEAELAQARLALQEREEETERLRSASEENAASHAAERAGLQAEIRRLNETIEERRSEGAELRSRLAQARDRQEDLDRQKKALEAGYEAVVKGLRREVHEKQATVERFRQTLRITFLDRILFGFSRVNVSEEGKAVLDNLAGALADIPEGRIRIAGHADNVPVAKEHRYRFPSNWELSSARAAAVARYLQENGGVDPTTMEIVGFSSYHPVADNATETGRARNRRVEITITPRSDLPASFPESSSDPPKTGAQGGS